MQAVQLLDFIHIAILSECVRERESKRESEQCLCTCTHLFLPELCMLQTVSFSSAQLCMGISCLLAKSKPSNHFSLGFPVTSPHVKTDATIVLRLILFRAVSLFLSHQT